MPFPVDSGLPSDIQAVEAALVAWHVALEAHDWVAVSGGLTPGFLMIEHDRIMDKAALLGFVRAGATKGRQRASLHGFRTEIHRDVAWTTVHNDELWIPDAGPSRAFSFLETAVFRHIAGTWLIDRYHATRLASEAA